MISPETLQRAKQIIDTIESLQAELAGLFGSSAGVSAAGGKRRGRPPGSAVAAAAVAGASSKRRRNMSAEGRARIAAAAKARWARFRSEQKKAAK